LAEAAGKAATERDEADGLAAHVRADVQSRSATLADTLARLDTLDHQLAADKAEHLEQMRRAAHRQNEAVATRAQLDNLRRERERLRLRSEHVAGSLAS